jgi:hypothetical protein
MIETDEDVSCTATDGNLNMRRTMYRTLAMMSALVSLVALVLFFAFASISAAQDQRSSRSFTGQIMDIQCAESGSHKSQMQKNDATNSRECTLACFRSGYKLVLYDRPAKTIYQLDNQEKAKQFAGENARVTGAFEDSTKTIYIDRIEAR